MVDPLTWHVFVQIGWPDDVTWAPWSCIRLHLKKRKEIVGGDSYKDVLVMAKFCQLKVMKSFTNTIKKEI